MSIENGNTQSERQIKILAARLEQMNDASGRQFSNQPQLTLLVEGQREAEWRFEQIGKCFVAHVDGFFQVFFHDGSEKNAGGFAGRSYELDMIDGSKRTIRGPWAGAPSTFYQEVTKKFGHLVDVHFAENAADFSKRASFFGLWISLDRALEACAKCETVIAESPMIKPVPIVTLRDSVRFALVKQPESGYEWGNDGGRFPAFVQAQQLEDEQRKLAHMIVYAQQLEAKLGIPNELSHGTFVVDIEREPELVVAMTRPRDRNLIEGET